VGGSINGDDFVGAGESVWQIETTFGPGVFALEG
jgi:hypothetical protein